MTATEIWSNFLIGIIAGLISGMISGLVVTFYYRRKDELQKWLMLLSEDKQNMSRFIIEVRYEIDLMMSDLTTDRAYIKRLLNKSPRFTSFDISKIDKEHQDATRNAYRLFDEIEDYLNIETIEHKNLYDYKHRLLRVQFDILKINTKPITTEIVQ